MFWRYTVNHPLMLSERSRNRRYPFLGRHIFMKHLLLLLFLTNGCCLLSAQAFQNFNIVGILGTRLYTDNDEGPSIGEAWRLKSSLSVGFEISHKKYPGFSLSYLYDMGYVIDNRIYQPPVSSYISNLISYSRGNYYGIYYQKKNLKYGLGYYKNLHEGGVNYTFVSNPFAKKSVALSIALTSGRAEFELVKMFQYHQLFAVFGIDLQYINIKYKLFGKKDAPPLSKSNRNSKTLLAFKVGLRGFPVKNNYLPGEDEKRVGASLQTGIELKFKKIHTALFVERDWWVRLNGGSPTRDLNGYVVNSVLGLKYSLPKWKNAFITAGYDWTTDYNTIYEIRDEVYSGNRDRIDLFYYNVKGIALGIGVPIFKKFDLDFRSILPLRGEKIGNPMRYSLGIAYKIYP